MIKRTLEGLKLLIIDVDGVLTGGSVIYNDKGEETKVFDVKDGLGIRLLMEAGINVCIATGRRSEALHHRCRDLGIVHIFDGVRNKASILDLILDRTGVSAEESACVGDDLPDLALMQRVGLAIAVADAHQTVIEHADMVTSAKGGAGAVREVCESILKARGLWENILERFM
ncbi:MAG: HAD-IIIA family hydrolase [Pseudomonadota bacterium]|uniref:HAD-IIIA family hydrolase n=1 Tax=Candidatus Desulfatibia profunda TaxID=2841695 RepID=A0A8J6TKZ9_9BACT|nr:HAD-IIIA family hydrolase [Candidatus Desulfatibia profunda]MBL7180855.1 HAD-IIIA family hydrolase [Desulfobacterales bacterium]MBU0697960.1 HAD-IIIA family hydrolase [Pseudomonadota bacterium]MBU1956752.1 HAD-IIIA family hydrolase [Patescibacteria group bacterium]